MVNVEQARRTPIAAYAGVVLAVVFWGISFIATKIALRYLPPLTIVALRFGLGTGVLALAAGAQGRLTLLPKREIAAFALLGAFGITFHQWLQTTGLVTAQATTTAWIISITPVLIVLLGALALRERFGLWQIAGLLAASLGALIVVSDGDWRAIAAGRFGTPGDWLVLAGALVWAVFSVVSKPLLRNRPAGQVMLYVMGFGWLFALLLAVPAGLRPAALLQVPLPGWLALAFLGVCCSGIAYVLWYGGLEGIPASRVGAFLYLEPVVTAIAATSLLGEVVTLWTWLGGAGIVAGVWLVNRSS